MTSINSNKEDLSTIQAKDVTINSCPSYSNNAHMHLIFTVVKCKEMYFTKCI